MRMFEKLKINGKYADKDDMNRAQVVYDRFAAYWRKTGASACDMRSLAQFLLEDVDCERLDSFMWDKGQLVNTSDGKLGVTAGWGWAATGLSSSHFAVKVDTADGVKLYTADALSKADVPPAVLEYVKSTLQGKVHDKVDEAFKEN